MKTKISALAVLCALVALGFGVRGSNGSPAMEERISHGKALPVAVVEATQEEGYSVAREYLGRVEAKRKSELAFERAGKLVGLHVEEGDRVVEGERLAEVDSVHLESVRREIEAEHREASAALDEMLAGPRRESVETARAEMEDVREQLALNRAKRRRAETLFSNRAIARDAFDETVSSVKQLEARLEAAVNRLDEVSAGTRSERLLAQRSAVEALDARLATVDVELDQTVLYAPFDGVVSRRFLDEGSVVAPGEPVLTLVEDLVVRVRVGLPIEDASRLSLGESIRVKVGSNSYSGTVSAVLPGVNPATRTKTVLIALPEATGFSTLGRVARVGVEHTVHSVGFWLPIGALTRGVRGLWICYALGEEKGLKDANVRHLEQREVEVLHAEANRVYARGSLRDGDRIVASGLHRLALGQLVRPLSRNSES